MIEKWSNLFMATASVAGALLGLMFVAISINVNKILSISNLTRIALQPISLLLVIVILSILMLIPEQTTSRAGMEIFFTGLVIWATTIQSDISIYHSIKDKAKKRHYIRNILFSQATILPIIVSGVITFIMGRIGIYWLIPGIILSFIKVVMNSWALLVEINR